MKTKQLLLTLLLVCIGSVGWAQISRDVHWIHGLGGDAGSWNETAQLFQAERQINTPVRGTYETGQGVGQMALEVRNGGSIINGANLIGIAHSMGGVASRQVDVNFPGHFGAIITFGSPLRGARIVNAVAGGEAQEYMSNGIHKLSRGPLAQALSLWPQIMSVDISDWFATHIVRGIAGSLSLRNQTVPDLSEESGYNQGFYGAATPTPKLMMWGEEDSPVHVRLASSFSTFRVPASIFWWPLAFFGNPILNISIDENTAVNLWNGTRYFYGFMEDLNRVQGYVPWAFLARWRSNEWQAGHEYMFSQSEGQWRVMTGASFAQTTTYSVWAPSWGTTEEQLMYCTDNNLVDGDCPYLFQMVQTYQSFINTPTDGVVPVRSQIAEGTAWRPNDPNFIRRLGGDNHQSMRSSEAGRNELRAAFEGDFGNEFRIGRRP